MIKLIPIRGTITKDENGNIIGIVKDVKINSNGNISADVVINGVINLLHEEEEMKNLFEFIIEKAGGTKRYGVYCSICSIEIYGVNIANNYVFICPNHGVRGRIEAIL